MEESSTIFMGRERREDYHMALLCSKRNIITLVQHYVTYTANSYNRVTSVTSVYVQPMEQHSYFGLGVAMCQHLHSKSHLILEDKRQGCVCICSPFVSYDRYFSIDQQLTSLLDMNCLIYCHSYCTMYCKCIGSSTHPGSHAHTCN